MNPKGTCLILRMTGPTARWNRFIIRITPERAWELLKLVADFEVMFERGVRMFQLPFVESEGAYFTKGETGGWEAEERPFTEVVIRLGHVVFKGYPWRGDPGRSLTSQEISREKLLELARGVLNPKDPPAAGQAVKPPAA